MPKNKTFNAYMLRTFDECPQKFNFLYNLDINMPSDAARALLGDKIHVLANYYLNGKDTSKFEKTLTSEELSIFDRFKTLEILNTKCFASEYPFSVRLSEYYLTGRIDAVFQKGDKIIIADWKTGKKQGGTDYQSMIYLYALYKIFEYKKMNLPPENFEFVYFYLNSAEEVRITYNRQLFKEQADFLKSKIDEVFSTKNFTANPKQCYTCNFKTLCYNYSNKGMYLKSV